MPPVSRRAVLAGAALTTAALIVPITARRSRAAERNEGYEITDWIVIGPSGEVTHRVRGAAAAARRRSLYTDDEFVARVGWATASSPLPTRAAARPLAFAGVWKEEAGLTAAPRTAR